MSLRGLVNALLAKRVVSIERLDAHSHEDSTAHDALTNALLEKGVVSNAELEAHEKDNESEHDALHNALFAKGIVTPAEVDEHEPECDEAPAPATEPDKLDALTRAAESLKENAK